MGRIHLIAALCLAVLHSTTAAPAQPKPADPTAADKAKQHFQKGENLYQRGKFAEALAEYKKAHALRAHPAFIFNIAQCHRQLGQHKKALFFYRLFLSENPQTPNRVEVEGRIKEMEQKIDQQKRLQQQKGKVSIITIPAGAEIFVDRFDGSPAGKSPQVLALPPGKHVIMVKKRGYFPVNREINVPPGKLISLKVTLTKAPSLRPRTRPFYRHWWFWTGVGVSVTLAIAGTVTGALTLSKVDAWEKNHDPDARDSGRKLRRITDILLPSSLGVAVAVTIAATAVYWHRKKKEKAKAHIAPSCGPGGCSIWVTGRF